eukprot:CAMPEP_0204637844 /NCGR_PEP_ID=MMETSP0717-20131115/37556_1 /ASSEMBLY_ACC=CAM_ASM_000666 /TAXON_ID=230516 /ORGANISM="Chaetoceros curvisetus" /LENGTH=131 /DNA_ID=CAMNT_0051657363 /DNA_START=224 /DNA_END=616 /DNA_ORIENTATION=+
MTSKPNHPLHHRKGVLKQASAAFAPEISLNGGCDKNISTTSGILASANRKSKKSELQPENTIHSSSMNSPSLRPSPGTIHGSRKRRAFGSNGPLCDPGMHENESSSPLVFVHKTPDARTLQSQYHEDFRSQ